MPTPLGIALNINDDPDEFLDGADARYNNKPKSACPYKKKSKRQDWLDGWDQMDMEITLEKEWEKENCKKEIAELKRLRAKYPEI